MKIIHVELGRHLYGGARQVVYLLNGLNQLGVQNILVCADKSEISTAFEDDSIKIYPLKFSGDHDLGFIFNLLNILRLEKPDLLHIHSRRGDLLAAIAAKLARVQIVYSRRVDNPPNWFELKFKFPLFKHCITISQGIKSVLLNFGLSSELISCVPSAVDTERFKPRQSHDTNQFSIGVIAQLISRKGHQFLFDALPDVLKRHPNVQVLIYGKGPLEAELKASISQKGLHERVHFMGFRQDLENILPDLDLIVHPALMEGLGVSLLEAAASGIPIVACCVGGIPEIVRDRFNGLLAPPGDSQSLSISINEILEDRSKLKSYGQAGRSLVLKEFSIKRMVEGNHAVYEKIINLIAD